MLLGDLANLSRRNDDDQDEAAAAAVAMWLFDRSTTEMLPGG
jgi:hypothetical protein